MEKLLPAFEEENGFAPGSLSLTGKTAKAEDGTKLYELKSASGDSIWVKVEDGKLVKEEYYHNGSYGKDYIIHFLYKTKYTKEIIVTNNFQLYQNDSVVLYPKKVAGKFSNKGELFDILTNAKRKKQLKDDQVLLLTKKSAPYEQLSGDTRSA